MSGEVTITSENSIYINNVKENVKQQCKKTQYFGYFLILFYMVAINKKK